MTQEEKAKRYDEIIKKANKMYHENCEACQMRIEELIPELREESEDERIRKAVINVFATHKDYEIFFGASVKDILAWLKSQGEQKPVIDMKTPEESLGIDSDTYNKIVDECIYGEQKPAWSEEDEKICNLLYEEYKNIAYYSHSVEKAEDIPGEVLGWLKSLKYRVQPKQEWGTIDEKVATESIDMYESEVKELEDVKTKQEWSEEDELHIKELESLVKRVWAIGEHENDKDTIHKMSDLSFFLKTLKPQPKQKWSEDDEQMLTEIVKDLQVYKSREISRDAKDAYQNEIDWLKSLRPQSQWKPSDEQIKALWEVYKGGEEQAALASLYSDLKKIVL